VRKHLALSSFARDKVVSHVSTPMPSDTGFALGGTSTCAGDTV
jgi:hypothetical protein